MSKKKITVARLEKYGKRFEILVNVDKAWRYRNGEKIDIYEILEGEFIYYDVRQGLKASESDLRKVFGTDDVYRVAELILKEGELLLTSEQRKELIEAKKRQIIDFLARNTIDPRTGLPHPPKRIELAMQEARIGIDPLKPIEVQINTVIKALRPILPLKIAKSIVAVKIPPKYIGRVYGPLSKLGKIIRDTYLSDGTWIAELEIPAGMQEILVNRVNEVTRGKGEVKILKTV